MTVAFPNAGPVTLKTNLADYPVTHALRTGEVKSDLVRFDFAGPKVAYEGFKPMVREGAFDAGELAIVTFLQAKQYGKPLVLLPAVVMGGVPHPRDREKKEKRTPAPHAPAGPRPPGRAHTPNPRAWPAG